MASVSFGSMKPLAGKVFRDGPQAQADHDLRKDIDAAFQELEKVVTAGWEACRAACDANVADLASVSTTLDGLTLVAGDRVLVMNQSDAFDNGIYVVGAVDAGTAPWTRATDLASADSVRLGDEVWVTGGTAYANTSWRVASIPSIWGVAGNLAFNRQLVTEVCDSEVKVDALITGAYIDGDRLKADGLTAANFKAALATDAIDPGDQIAKWKADSMTAALLKKLLPVEALDFSDTDIRAAVKAATIPTSKLVVATEGQALPATDGSPSPVVVVPFTLGATTGSVYFKADRKYELLKIQLCKTGTTGGTSDKWVFAYDAISDGTGTYADYLNASGSTGISADGVAANTEPAVLLDRTKCTIASGGSIKMTGVKSGLGASVAARGFLHLVAVA